MNFKPLELKSIEKKSEKIEYIKQFFFYTRNGYIVMKSDDELIKIKYEDVKYYIPDTNIFTHDFMQPWYIPVENEKELTYVENEKHYINLKYKFNNDDDNVNDDNVNNDDVVKPKKTKPKYNYKEDIAKFLDDYASKINEKKYDVKCDELYELYVNNISENHVSQNKFGRYIKNETENIQRKRKGEGKDRYYIYRFKKEIPDDENKEIVNDKKKDKNNNKKEIIRMDLNDLEIIEANDKKTIEKKPMKIKTCKLSVDFKM